MLIDQGYTNYQISGVHLKILGARKLSSSTLNTQHTVHHGAYLKLPGDLAPRSLCTPA